MALAMDLVETQQASQPEEVFPETAVAENLGELQTCSKCQQSLPVKLLVHKSKNSYLRKPRNRTGLQAGRAGRLYLSER